MDQQFEVMAGGEVVWSPGWVVVSGEIDVTNAAVIGKRIRGLLAPPAVTVDCTAVTFVDVAGIRMLAQLGAAAAAVHTTVRLHCSPAMAEVFRLCEVSALPANDVFAGYGCPITCIWHSRRHPAHLLDGLREVHGQHLTAHGEQDNPRYLPAATYLSVHAQTPMTPVPPGTDLDILLGEHEQLATCRTAIARWASRRHFAPAAVRQVALATGEVIANGLHHGQPPVHVRAWTHHDTLIVHIEDHGARPLPADAGYRPPSTLTEPGGLWIARQLADVLLTHTGHGRTAVRLHFPHAVTHHNLDIP